MTPVVPPHVSEMTPVVTPHISEMTHVVPPQVSTETILPPPPETTLVPPPLLSQISIEMETLETPIPIPVGSLGAAMPNTEPTPEHPFTSQRERYNQVNQFVYQWIVTLWAFVALQSQKMGFKFVREHHFIVGCALASFDVFFIVMISFTILALKPRATRSELRNVFLIMVLTGGLSMVLTLLISRFSTPVAIGVAASWTVAGVVVLIVGILRHRQT